jgi:hypothetical protein
MPVASAESLHLPGLERTETRVSEVRNRSRAFLRGDLYTALRGSRVYERPRELQRRQADARPRECGDAADRSSGRPAFQFAVCYVGLSVFAGPRGALERRDPTKTRWHDGECEGMSDVKIKSSPPATNLNLVYSDHIDLYTQNAGAPLPTARTHAWGSYLHIYRLETRVQSDGAHARVESHDVRGGTVKRQCNMQRIERPQCHRFDIEQ